MGNIPPTNIPSLDQLSSLISLAGIKNLPLPTPTNIGQFLIVAGGLSTVILVIVLWSLVWKGMALWYAARRGEKGWFILLLVLNTLGILEMIYIFAVAKRSDVSVKKTETLIQPPSPKV